MHLPPKLFRRRFRHLSEATNVVVDLTESTFLDSIIIGVLFAGYRLTSEWPC